MDKRPVACWHIVDAACLFACCQVGRLPGRLALVDHTGRVIRVCLVEKGRKIDGQTSPVAHACGSPVRQMRNQAKKVNIIFSIICPKIFVKLAKYKRYHSGARTDLCSNSVILTMNREGSRQIYLRRHFVSGYAFGEKWESGSS